MRKIIISFALLLSITFYSQVGIGTTVVQPSAALELSSTNKALLLSRVANTASVALPENGMMVFDQSSNCFKVYYNDKWTDCLGRGINAVLAQIGYEADNPNTIPSIVTIAQLQSVPGVVAVNPLLETQYQSYIDANPDLFSRPATAAEVNAMLAAVLPIAEVSNYSCSTASIGNMTQGISVNGVTQTITATVTTIGFYNISATTNGVTFSASGTFSATGNQNVLLVATGTPTEAGYINFTLNTTPNCSFIRPTTGPDDVLSATGKIWKNKNLGATQVATSSNDPLAYGDLYQWGRGADGHQIRTSGTTTIQSVSDTPGHGDYITGHIDWRSPRNNNLWQGINGINNPCPSGYRIPTVAEFVAEAQIFPTQNSQGALNSALKIPLGGNRDFNSGLINLNQTAYYWTSTIFNSSAMYFAVGTGVGSDSNFRSQGFSVRCIRD